MEFRCDIFKVYEHPESNQYSKIITQRNHLSARKDVSNPKAVNCNHKVCHEINLFNKHLVSQALYVVEMYQNNLFLKDDLMLKFIMISVSNSDIFLC